MNDQSITDHDALTEAVDRLEALVDTVLKKAGVTEALLDHFEAKVLLSWPDGQHNEDFDLCREYARPIHNLPIWRVDGALMMRWGRHEVTVDIGDKKFRVELDAEVSL